VSATFDHQPIERFFRAFERFYKTARVSLRAQRQTGTTALLVVYVFTQQPPRHAPSKPSCRGAADPLTLTMTLRRSRERNLSSNATMADYSCPEAIARCGADIMQRSPLPYRSCYSSAVVLHGY